MLFCKMKIYYSTINQALLQFIQQIFICPFKQVKFQMGLAKVC